MPKAAPSPGREYLPVPGLLGRPLVTVQDRTGTFNVLFASLYPGKSFSTISTFWHVVSHTRSPVRRQGPALSGDNPVRSGQMLFKVANGCKVLPTFLAPVWPHLPGASHAERRAREQGAHLASGAVAR